LLAPAKSWTIEAKLQKLVANDDAIIIRDVGGEKLNYVSGTVTIITSTSINGVSLDDIGLETAQTLPNNPKWKTQLDY